MGSPESAGSPLHAAVSVASAGAQSLQVDLARCGRARPNQHAAAAAVHIQPYSRHAQAHAIVSTSTHISATATPKRSATQSRLSRLGESQSMALSSMSPIQQP